MTNEPSALLELIRERLARRGVDLIDASRDHADMLAIRIGFDDPGIYGLPSRKQAVLRIPMTDLHAARNLPAYLYEVVERWVDQLLPRNRLVDAPSAEPPMQSMQSVGLAASRSGVGAPWGPGEDGGGSAPSTSAETKPAEPPGLPGEKRGELDLE